MVNFPFYLNHSTGLHSLHHRIQSSNSFPKLNLLLVTRHLLLRKTSLRQLTLPMSGDEAKERIDEDVNEFFAVCNLEKADVYFTALPEEHHFRLINKLVVLALESTEADAHLVAEFFA